MINKNVKVDFGHFVPTAQQADFARRQQEAAAVNPQAAGEVDATPEDVQAMWDAADAQGE